MKVWKPLVIKPVTEEVTKDTNGAESVSDKLDKNKETNKGGNDMGMDEDFKEFMKEQARFNQKLGDFIGSFSEKEQRKVETNRIQEQIQSVMAPIKEKVDKQAKLLGDLQEKLEPFGELCTTVGECKEKLAKFEKAVPEKKGKGELSKENLTEVSYKELKELSEAGNLGATKVLEQRQEKLGKFHSQEKYDSIKDSPTAVADLDDLYTDKFANDPEYRKLAFSKLSVETFVDDAKKKVIEDKLIGMCQDKTCRVDVEKMMKEAKGPGEKKLLKKS